MDAPVRKAMTIQRVRYACGDTQAIYLLSSSPRTRKEIVQQLQRSLCPACLRRSRYEDAHWRAEQAGLHPLQATHPQQLSLAEVIRTTLWDLLLPRNADEQSCQLLAVLFNQQTQASFWLSMRGWPMYRANIELVKHLLLGLLHTPEKENTHD